jgi:DNA-binding NarL/FixJ family response regulator
MLLAESPTTKVIILSGRLTSSLAAEARDAGAVGYVLKTDEADDILRGIRAVMAGESAWTPAAAASLGLV